MKLIHLLGPITATAALALIQGSAAAAAPERYVESEQAVETIGTCAAGDELVIDYVRTSTVTVYASGRATLHLQMVGTITRTGTGVVGKYAERQRDFGEIEGDGSERYVGLLGHLVVPGGGGFTFAGQAWLSPDGSLSLTHGLEPLLVLDFVPVVCDALAG
ncbi:exported hypothetical protein [metagenome]|uniref:Uncharacterized protein n=1 Tax=metagenome TaxID=256318 RepID=A0A2P2C5M4_9ZZZZ